MKNIEKHFLRNQQGIGLMDRLEDVKVVKGITAAINKF